MNGNEWTIRVPASTANLGPGFDSIGLALDLHLNIHAASAAEWEVVYRDSGYQHLSAAGENLIVQTAEAVAARFGRSLPAARLEIGTDIPLGRGLGSSAAAIAAGIELADLLLGLDLPMDEKVKIGSRMEGHPDNVAASLLGGLSIFCSDGDELDGIRVENVPIGAVILVPPSELLTKESRGLLPDVLSHREAVKGSAAGNVLAAALVQGDWKTAGRMMEKDHFHEPYRKALFPDFDRIRRAAREAGAYGSAISGAGPSLFIAVPKGREEAIGAVLAGQFPHYECIVTAPALAGIRSSVSVS